MANPSAKTANLEAVSYRIFPKINWAGCERLKVEITYANEKTRPLPPEFKDEDTAFRYMDRFYSALPRQK